MIRPASMMDSSLLVHNGFNCHAETDNDIGYNLTPSPVLMDNQSLVTLVTAFLMAPPSMLSSSIRSGETGLMMIVPQLVTDGVVALPCPPL